MFVQKDAIIMLWYLYLINLEGEIYKKSGLGCYCCGWHGDLFGFISSKTNIPREKLYMINGSEKIYDKNFDVRKYHFAEYFFSTDPDIVKIKIKFREKEFFVFLDKEELYYENLIESIEKKILYYISWLGCKKRRTK